MNLDPQTIYQFRAAQIDAVRAGRPQPKPPEPEYRKPPACPPAQPQKATAPVAAKVAPRNHVKASTGRPRTKRVPVEALRFGCGTFTIHPKHEDSNQ